jgi:uncharacterized protein
MGRPVVHFEIMGQDGAALRQFYAALFDWRFDTTTPPAGYGLVDSAANGEEGARGIGGGVGGIPGYHGHVTVYVDVPDVVAALEQAERLGGRRVMGSEWVTECIEIGQFVDPEGNLVGLVTSHPSARVEPEQRSGRDT